MNLTNRFSQAVLLLAIAGLPARAALVYTCDANITAVGQGCNFLNTTIQNLYTSTFNDVNASIYIKLGATDLGASTSALNDVSYTGATGYYSALKLDRTTADDNTAVGTLNAAAPPAGLPADMTLTNANVRALPGLGITPADGFDKNGNACLLVNAGCYDGVITISQAKNTGNQLWFRQGAQGANQFDFYAVVEHETDEVLGSGSCAFDNNGAAPAGFCNGRFAPDDLFRRKNNGTIAFGAQGSNAVCNPAGPNVNNACFTIDGGTTMIVGMNNILNGANTNDAGDYSTNCAHVQDAAGCLGGGQFNVSGGFELKELDVIGFTQAPEPAAELMIGLGLAALGIARARFRSGASRG